MSYSVNLGEESRRALIYTVDEAGALTGLHSSTVKRWVFGENDGASVLGKHLDGYRMVSFLTLVEVAVAKSFRESGFGLDWVREAHKSGAERCESDYPFASKYMPRAMFEFYLRETGIPQEKLSLDVWLSPTVREVSAAIDYAQTDGLAVRWFPMGRAVPIVIDPQYATGKPTVPGRGVTVGAIHSRYKEGFSVEFIADDLVLEQAVVKDALRFGDRIAV